MIFFVTYVTSTSSIISVISINKNMHNHNLDDVEKVLKKCEELMIDGIFYCDVAVLNIHRKLSLTIPLVWNAEHLATNYNTINYWAKNGISYAFLSNEITLDEIKEIKKNVTIPLIAQAFGYIPMYVSKRHAIDNYFVQCGASEQLEADWQACNPEDFTYHQSYFGYEELYEHTYADDYESVNDIYFIDTYSCTFPGEDRSRVFEFFGSEYCKEDWLLESKPLQRKARLLLDYCGEYLECFGEDEAYGLKQKAEERGW